MRTAIPLLLILFAVSCAEQTVNERHIKIRGCVTDSLTRKGLSNAKVTILCWYDAGWDKTDYVSIDTFTDKNGCFAVTLEKGYKATVASVAADYYPSLKSSDKVKGKPVEINLMLARRQNSNTNFDVSSNEINLRYYIVANSDEKTRLDTLR